MKEQRTFEFCEECNKAWEVASPPTKQAYNSGLIRIVDGSMLLKKPKKKKRGETASHAEWIEGIYCNIECLIKHLKKMFKT